MHSAVIGFGLGFLVALQLGPMSLFLVRSTLRGGFATGFAVAGGIALVDMAYAAAGALGAASVLAIAGVRTGLHLVGAAVLIWLGIQSLRAARSASVKEDREGAGSPYRAFRTSVGATAANPTTILSWAAIFASLPKGTQAVPLVIGVGLGSLTWMTILAGSTTALRTAVGPRTVRVADAIAGVGLIAFGVALALS